MDWGCCRNGPASSIRTTILSCGISGGVSRRSLNSGSRNHWTFRSGAHAGAQDQHLMRGHPHDLGRQYGWSPARMLGVGLPSDVEEWEEPWPRAGDDIDRRITKAFLDLLASTWSPVPSTSSAPTLSKTSVAFCEP